MLDIARNGGEEEPVSLAAVAGRTSLSRGYLEQLALALRNARLIRGVSGRSGGYRLAQPPDAVTVGQVIEAAIGPVCVVDCVDDPEGCPRSEFCECRVVYSLINARIAEVLHSFTLSDLLDPSWAHMPELIGDQHLITVDGGAGPGCGWTPPGSRKKESP